MPLPGSFKADAANAADFILAVGQNIRSNRLAVFLLGLMGAEVNSPGELPDNHKVDSLFHNLRL